MVITVEFVAFVIIIFIIIIAAMIFMPRSRNYMNPEEMPTFLSPADIDDLKAWFEHKVIDEEIDHKVINDGETVHETVSNNESAKADSESSDSPTIEPTSKQVVIDSGKSIMIDLTEVEDDFAEALLSRAKNTWGKSFIRMTLEKIPAGATVAKESDRVTRCVIPLESVGRKELSMVVNHQAKFFIKDQPIVCNARMKHSITNDSDKDIAIVCIDITDEYSYI